MHTFLAQRLVAMIALLGVLFGALAPAMSHAIVPAASGIGEVQICTMAGMKTIVIDGADATGKHPPDPHRLSKHCPYCALHGGAALPPGAPAGAFFPVVRAMAAPAPHAQPPASSFSWNAAPPRAPPFPT